MKLIRINTFETNSSSTHALVIPHIVETEDYSLSDSLDHNYMYGRGESRLVEDWDEKLAYLYITIDSLIGYKWSDEQYSITKEMVQAFKDRVNKIYDEVYKMVEYKPYDGDPKPNDIFNYIENDGKCDLVKDYIVIHNGYMYPYVDHVGEFNNRTDFFDKVFNDDEFLKRFIFNKDAYITIGGDEYRGYNIKTVGFEYDYKNDDEFWAKLKEYEKDNDVFLKGN